MNPPRAPDTKGVEEERVNCIGACEKLLDAAEGALEADEDRLLRTHLAGCAKCSAEFDAITAGMHALRRAVPVVAPREHYLTRARRDRVSDGGGPRIFRLATYRQFVGAAAAAAILISAAFITAQVLGILDARRLQDAPAVAAQQPAPGLRYAPLTVSAPGQTEPISVAHTMRPVAAAVQAPAPPPTPPLRTDTAGITVPVNHAFYDPEEASHWW